MGRLNSRLIIARTQGLAPPPLVPAALTGLAKVELRFTMLGEQMENVWHVKKVGAWTDEQLQDMAQAVLEQFSDSVMPELVDDLSLNDAKATDLSVADGNSVVFTPDEPSLGSQLGTPSSPFEALKVKLRTAVSGRAGTGWKRIPGLPDGDTTSGVIESGKLTSVNSALSEFLTELVTTGYQLVVASFFNNLAPRATPLATPITELLCLPQVTTQNSRKFGRGD